MKPDVGRESRFFAYLLSFEAPVTGLPVGILPQRLVRKSWNGRGYPMVNNFEENYLFVLTEYEECDEQTDRQTDRHHATDRPRLCIVSCGKNVRNILHDHSAKQNIPLRPIYSDTTQLHVELSCVASL